MLNRRRTAFQCKRSFLGIHIKPDQSGKPSVPQRLLISGEPCLHLRHKCNALEHHEHLLPSLRVDPDLRQAAENVLNEGESLSSLTESSLRSCVTRRQLQRDLLPEGLLPAMRPVATANTTPRLMCMPSSKRCLLRPRSGGARVEFSGPLHG
jgi:hypothetical protein